MRPFLFLLFILLATRLLPAQQTLSLEQCLDLVVANNLQLRQNQNQLELAQVTLLQQKFEFLPSISAGLQVSKSFGTSVDNFTQQIANSPYTGSPNLGATLTLFQGLSRWHDVRNADYRLEATHYSIEDLKNDLRLNVALAFFQAIFAQDQQAVAQARYDLLLRQLEKVQALMEVGTRTMGDVYSIKAQVATERVTIIQQENAYQTHLLNLLQAMNLDVSASYTLQRPDIEALAADSLLPPSQDIILAAKAQHPGMRARAMEALATRYAMKSAQTQYFPTLTLSYGMGSFYSSNNRPILRLAPGPGGNLVPVYGDPISLSQQLEDNYGQSLSLGLNVPIFTNYGIKRSYTSTKVTYANALLQLEIEEMDLEKEVQQAYQDAKAARAQLAAADEQVVSAQEAYTYAQAKHDAGLMDFYTLMEALDAKTRAEAGRLQSQYDFILKRKILDIYQGQSLTF